MHGLQALAWRGLWARPLRTALTTFGVALGVAVLFAGLATNAGMSAAIDRTVGTTIGRADLRLESFGETGLTSATRAAVTATPGIAVVAPTLERRTYLDVDLVSAGSGETLPPPVTIVGLDVVAEPRLHDLPVAEGTWLADPAATDAVISASLAAQDHLGIGSTVSFLGDTDFVTYRVAGILAGDGPWATRTDRTVLVPLATAQAAFGTDTLTRLDLGLAEGATLGDVMDTLESDLDEQPYVLSTPADLAAAMRASTTDFAATTALIAAVALFAGAFLIFNTLSMTVVERVRELGLLRAAGATRGQLTSFILLQATVIGVLGTVVGIVLGAVLALAMTGWLQTVGTIGFGGPVVGPADIVTAFLIGLVVTVAAALEPARRAGRIPPVEALKSRFELPTARRARLRWLVGVFALIGVVGLLAWPRDGGDASIVRALLVYATLLVATLLVPVVLPALARVAGLVFVPLTRLEERLARASVLRDRSRSALTVGALTVGLAMIVALGGVAGHARAAASAWIADVVPGDLVVTSIFPRAADEGLVDTLGALPGVARLSPFATFDVAVGGVRTDGAAMAGADLATDGRLRFVAGDRVAALTAIDRGGAVIVPQALAARDGLHLDQEMSLTGADGSTVPVRIAGIAERTLPGRAGESLLVGWTDATRLGVAGADAFAVRFTSAATAAQRSAFATEARSLALEPTTLDRIQGAIGEALDRVFGLFDALALVAVIVAALGIVNTLTMNVLERVREIGVLRAAGMTRRQVWRSVVVEAGITGLVGAICGVVTGLVVGALMVVLAGGRLDIAVAVPWLAVGVAIVGGVTLAMLAAAYPARLASGVSIVRAVGYE